MFVDRQRIDLLNRLIDARVDLAAYVQLRKAKEDTCPSAKAIIYEITFLN